MTDKPDTSDTPSTPPVRTSRYKPYDDPMIRTAEVKKQRDYFQEVMRKSREEARHKNEEARRGRCGCGLCGS